MTVFVVVQLSVLGNYPLAAFSSMEAAEAYHRPDLPDSEFLILEVPLDP